MDMITSVRSVAAACLCVSFVACGDISGVDGSRPKVLLIGLDGVRVDVLASVHTPNIDSLMAQGTFSDRAQTRPPTVSGHGWSNMLTGVWANKHRVTSNDLTGNDYARYPDFFTRPEQVDPTFNTLAILGRSSFGWTTLLGDAIDATPTFDSDAASVSWATVALEYLDLDAVFVWLSAIDGVGHKTSSLDPEYRRAIEIADVQVGALVAALTRRLAFGLGGLVDPHQHRSRSDGRRRSRRRV